MKFFLEPSTGHIKTTMQNIIKIGASVLENMSVLWSVLVLRCKRLSDYEPFNSVSGCYISEALKYNQVAQSDQNNREITQKFSSKLYRKHSRCQNQRR